MQSCHTAPLPCLLSAVGLQEKERNREQKKSLTPLQQLDEEGLAEQADADVTTIQVR